MDFKYRDKSLCMKTLMMVDELLSSSGVHFHIKLQLQNEINTKKYYLYTFFFLFCAELCRQQQHNTKISSCFSRRWSFVSVLFHFKSILFKKPKMSSSFQSEHVCLVVMSWVNISVISVFVLQVCKSVTEWLVCRRSECWFNNTPQCLLMTGDWIDESYWDYWTLSSVLNHCSWPQRHLQTVSCTW